MTSQYAAEHGNAGGAQINVVTKRGKKDFHGALYGFLRDDRFDARNFRAGHKDTLDFRNLGWNLTGPVAAGGFNADRDGTQPAGAPGRLLAARSQGDVPSVFGRSR